MNRLASILLFWTVLLYLSRGTSAEEKSRVKRAPSSWLSSPKLTINQTKYIVDQHNAKRRIVQPPASNMKHMVWDEELAAKASDYSKKCSYEHANEPGIGENIAIYAENNVEKIIKIIEKFVSNWNDEGLNYDFENRECKTDEVCGHYTQVVWAESNRVGCGMSRCKDINIIGEDGEGYILVCNYKPAGNAVLNFDGTLVPLAPYRDGPPCTECDQGQVCLDKLCAEPPAITPANPVTLADIVGSSGDETDMCYQQNKKIIDTWNYQMREWREVYLTRWERSMDKYEEYLKEFQP